MAKYEVSVLLSCGHVNTIYIDAAPFAPSVGSSVTCRRCNQVGTIKKKSEPAYMGDTAPNPTIERQNAKRD